MCNKGYCGKYVKASCILLLFQVLSHVQLFATPWTAAQQTSLAFTISWSLLKPMSIELVMPSNYLILCHSLFLLPSVLPCIRVFSSESALFIGWPKYWSFSFSISLGLIDVWMQKKMWEFISLLLSKMLKCFGNM